MPTLDAENIPFGVRPSTSLHPCSASYRLRSSCGKGGSSWARAEPNHRSNENPGQTISSTTLDRSPQSSCPSFQRSREVCDGLEGLVYILPSSANGGGESIVFSESDQTSVGSPNLLSGSAESLIKKEATSRKIIFMSEAMERRQVVSRWGEGKSSSAESSFSGASSDAGQEGVERRPATGGRPLTTGRFIFATPPQSPIDMTSGEGESRRMSLSESGLAFGATGPQDGWIVDNANTLSLFTAQKYPKAYVTISSLLSQYQSSYRKTAILCCRRGKCSFFLMNYQECLDDFRSADRCIVALRRKKGSMKLISSEDLNEVEMLRMWIKAYIMREDYRAANQLYAKVIARKEELGLSQELCTAMAAEQRALEDVERFRSSVAQERWKDALRHLEKSKCVVEETPLLTVQAVAYLEAGQVDLARETLLPYLPLIPLPLKAEAATEASPEERQLRCNVETHYLLTTVLLAKASVYSGRQYINIAATLTQRCLQVHPCYGPAMRMGNYLLSLEDALANIDRLMAENLYEAALGAIQEALTLDPANHRICAMLRNRRAEVRIEMGQFSQAFEECSQSLALDPTCAKTYITRAKAYDALDRKAEAEEDRRKAIQLQPSCEGFLREEQRKKNEAVRRAREQKQRELKRDQHSAASSPNIPPRWKGPFAASDGSNSSGASEEHAESFFPKGGRPPFSGTGRASDDEQKDYDFLKPKVRETLYDVLSVPVLASNDKIRKAFKQLILRCHPDKMVTASKLEQSRALEMFKAVNHAYSILSNPTRRAEYDLTILMHPQ